MSFQASSTDIRLDGDGYTLRAKAKKKNGKQVDSQIDLNSCIGNTNGTFPSPVHPANTDSIQCM